MSLCSVAVDDLSFEIARSIERNDAMYNIAMLIYSTSFAAFSV